MPVIIAFVICILAFSNFLSWQRRKYANKQKYTVIAIRVSKTNEVGPIVAEQIFATLHGIFHKLSWMDVLRGKQQDRVSFEIAHTAQQIKFYIWFPSKLRNLVEGQIYAQYPNSEIEEVQDYALSEAAERAVGAELRFEEPVIYPIKRYPQFEDKLTRVPVDPIAGITATLAHLNDPGDTACIQVVTAPLDARFRLIYLKCLRIVTKGVLGNIEILKKTYIRLFTTRNLKLKLFFFPMYVFFWLQGVTSGMKHISLGLGSDASSSDELREEMSRAHERETDIDASSDKISKLMFAATIRILYIPHDSSEAERIIKLREIAGSFKQFSISHLNGFAMKNSERGAAILGKYMRRDLDSSLVLNTEELATIYHLPHMSVATPNIAWVRSKKLEPPSDLPTGANAEGNDGFTLLGRTNFRRVTSEFGIKTADRRRHIYIIGKTGMGKSTLLENMIFSDIQSGKGVAIVDPHGDLADHVLDFVPSHRTNDVILFDPSDRDFPVAFNMLENIDPAYNSIVASGLVGIFKKIYGESWGPRLEHILRNTILALLEYPSATMLGITRMLQDADFRQHVVKKVEDPIVKSFWVNEFEKMQPRMMSEAISPILNKVGQFLSSPIIRNIVGQPKSSFSLRHAMDNKKIVVVNLSKGKIGEDNSALLGAMIITKFQLDAMSRANIPEKDRTDFYLYVDEFQNFATESFATILSEARKYRLNLTMANQYIAQMPEEVRDAVFGNVGTLISFQVGFDDAEAIAGQFGGDETMVNDLVALQVGNTYIRLLIDGMPTPVFSMTTFPQPDFMLEEERTAAPMSHRGTPILSKEARLRSQSEAGSRGSQPNEAERKIKGRREKIFKFCRERYSGKREVVEDKIKRWSASA